MPSRDARKTSQTTDEATTGPVAEYEAAAQELEGIVTRMERGDLKLEESLQLFERGMALTERCRKMLDTAELKVKNLLEKNTQAA